jgi:hypothetical protein
LDSVKEHPDAKRIAAMQFRVVIAGRSRRSALKQIVSWGLG